MDSKQKRKAIIAEYKSQAPDTGVFRIIHIDSGRYYLSHSLNLRSVEGKLSFAQKTDSKTFVDKRLVEEMLKYGVNAFKYECLERLEVKEPMSRDKLEKELIALEELWREKLGSEFEL